MIGIIDYGMGNIRNLQSFFNRMGFESILTGDETVLETCEIILLPGVGAFGEAMERLKKTNLDGAIKRWANEGRALIGICLGMQLLFESSEEFGYTEGLGVMKGKLVPFKDESLRIPHMGWNTLLETQANDAYFVHSYYVEGASAEDVVYTCEYGVTFPAMVKRGNFVGFQFHPEKSGDVGAALLKQTIDYLKNGGDLNETISGN